MIICILDNSIQRLIRLQTKNVHLKYHLVVKTYNVMNLQNMPSRKDKVNSDVFK